MYDDFTIRKICGLYPEELLEVLTNFLNIKGYKKITRGEKFIMAEGDLPLCLVAHVDTVFNNTPKDIYYDKEKAVMWSPWGLGADDRAGVFAIIKIIENGYRPSVIFTDYEEVGGEGAFELIEKYPECPFENCKALIELDRQGKNDACFYNCDNKPFEKIIGSFGFVPREGIFSDISIIAPAWGNAAVNLSIGYYDEHTYLETLNLAFCYLTIDKVEAMLRECPHWKEYKYYPKKNTKEIASWIVFENSKNF